MSSQDDKQIGTDPLGKIIGRAVKEKAEGCSVMDEVIRDFLIESHEGLDQLDKDLLSLEQDPTDSETLKRVFRTTHTIKGTCGFFGFSKLESDRSCWRKSACPAA
jgi:two-component system chemotaxis sensor kinase CheA